MTNERDQKGYNWNSKIYRPAWYLYIQFDQSYVPEMSTDALVEYLIADSMEREDGI